MVTLALALVNWVIGILCGSILVAALVVSLHAAITGRDVEWFERLKDLSPRQYRKVVWTNRINGLMVTGLCFFGVLFTPIIAMSPRGGIALAVAALVLFSLLLWLSLRWTLWGWRAKL